MRVGNAELLLIEEGGGRADECECVRFGVVFGSSGGFGQEQGPLERRTAGDCGGCIFLQGCGDPRIIDGVEQICSEPVLQKRGGLAQRVMGGVAWLQAEPEEWIRDIVAGFLSKFAGVNECEVAEIPELSRAAAFVDAGCHGELQHSFGTGLIAQSQQQLLLLGGQVVQLSETGGGECIESLFQQRCELPE